MEANRAKSAFLAAMSHELRTPLNAIGGYAQLIEMGVRGPVTEEQRTDLLKIQRSKNHLDGLVSDVLNFAKLGAGRIELNIEPVNVAHLVASVVEMIAPQLPEKHLTLAPVSIAGDLFVLGDVDKTRQILINLLANALKFTPAGGTIAVSASCTGADISISVSDTGIGVPADQHETIFEPFVQAKRAVRTTDRGVGLGLAISRQLARSMNGELTLRSEVGKGSTFTLRLPRQAP
jgi:signal transduction histidine kinase